MLDCCADNNPALRSAGARYRWLKIGMGMNISGQMLEEALPCPFLGPAAEPLGVFFQSPNRFRQVAPRNSSAVAVEHCFDESTIVAGGDADITGFAGQHVLDSLPLVMGQPCSKPTLHETHKLP